jgi:hypothetical protein
VERGLSALKGRTVRSEGRTARAGALARPPEIVTLGPVLEVVFSVALVMIVFAVGSVGIYLLLRLLRGQS